MGVAWPDSTYDLLPSQCSYSRFTRRSNSYRSNAGGSKCSLNPEPKHGKNTTRKYTKIAQPVPIAGSYCYWKRYVKVRANGSIENSRDSIAKSSHQGDQNCISSGKLISYRFQIADLALTRSSQRQPLKRELPTLQRLQGRRTSIR